MRTAEAHDDDFLEVGDHSEEESCSTLDGGILIPIRVDIQSVE